MKIRIKYSYYLIIIIFLSITFNPLNINNIKIEKKNVDESDFVNQLPKLSYTVNKTPFVAGIGNNPYAIDPVDTWDVPSHNVQHQVVEGLVEYNYSNHPNYDIIPVLAEEWHWHNNTVIEFKVRENVYFHDGTLLDANAVKWNFERLMYFCNATGSLPSNITSWEAFPSSLFYMSSGSFIFKEFEVDNFKPIGGGNYRPYNFTITLTTTFSPLLDLISFGATHILSPYSTPKYRYLDLSSEKLVGTGPFIYDEFIQDVHIKFHAYHNYWRGKADIEEMFWVIETDNTIRMNNALAGKYHYVSVSKAWIDTFKADPNWHVEDVGEDLCYFYLEIYCGPFDTSGNWHSGHYGDHQYQKNPPYLRRALALALNYSYIYDEIQSGYAFEGTTAVPRAMPGHNSSVVQASDSNFTWQANIVKARQLLKDNAADILARGGLDISTFDVNTSSDWEGKNILGRALEVNRHSGSTTNLRLNQLMEDNFDRIGIQIYETIRDWGDFLDTGEFSPWEIDIGYIGWCPDYLNPFNMIDPLFNLDSGSCFSRINDTSPGGLTELMELAASETDYGAQLDLYKDIQSLIFDVERPLNPASHVHISGWVYFVQSVYRPYLTGFHPNIMSILDFYPCEWDFKTPGYFLLSSDAGNPDYNGKFNLYWSESGLADNYTIYQYNHSIYEINGSLTEIASGFEGNSYPMSLSNGTWYFTIVAFNELGNISTNCLSVTIRIVPPKSFELTSDAGDPDYDGTFNLIWNPSVGADNYSVYKYDKYITYVNSSISTLANQTASSPFLISGLLNGTYYYIVIAYNGSGYRLSNCINITVKIIPPGPFNLSSNAGSPDTDGAFSLTWTISKGADNYSLYTYNHPITEINTSLTVLAYQVAFSPYSISGLLNGDYYYVVVAYSISGITLSNVLYINVIIEYSMIDGYTIVPPIIIDDSGKEGYTWSQVSILDWCSGSGTTGDPYLIEKIIINGEDLASCLVIKNSQVNFEIRNCTFTSSGSKYFDAGIKLINVTNGLLMRVNCSLNNNFGIILIDCLYITITKSDMNDNDVGGLYLINSDHNTIEDNDETINRNGVYGIKLNASLYNLISGNYISNNKYGIFIFRSNYTTVSENFLIKNDNGIEQQENDEETNDIGKDNTIKDITSDNEQIPLELIILIAIIGAVVILGITGASVWKKRIDVRGSKPKEKKIEKTRKKLEEKLDFVDYLIKEKKIKQAYRNLGKIKDTADEYDLFTIFNEANRRVEVCKDIEAGIHRDIEIEKSVEPKIEKSAEPIIEREVIKAPVVATPLIEKEVITKKPEKYRVFLSYSTLDSDYFQISRIVKKLETYPEIDRVLYWEADSARNIVQYMEETLKGSDVFVLFCSENSARSAAVRDEWMAAFQLRKKGGIEIIPVYENEENIPVLLMPLLNVKFVKENFSGFIKSLYEEILRKGS